MAVAVTSSGGSSIVAAVNGGTSVSFNQIVQSVSVSVPRTSPVVVANTLGPQGVKGADGADLTTELNAEIAQRALGDALNTNQVLAVAGQISLLRARLGSGTTGDDLSDINTPASDDKVLIQDKSDSNNLKYVDFGDFASGSLSNISEDGSPQLGANLDVQARSLFTSTSNGDIRFTPNGTGSVNLDGTVKFKRFASGSAPDPFEGGMYADDNDKLYFGVS